MTANDVSSCGSLRKKQRPRIAGPGLQTSALPLGYGAVGLGKCLNDWVFSTYDEHDRDLGRVRAR